MTSLKELALDPEVPSAAVDVAETQCLKAAISTIETLAYELAPRSLSDTTELFLIANRLEAIAAAWS